MSALAKLLTGQWARRKVWLFKHPRVCFHPRLSLHIKYTYELLKQVHKTPLRFKFLATPLTIDQKLGPGISRREANLLAWAFTVLEILPVSAPLMNYAAPDLQGVINDFIEFIRPIFKNNVIQIILEYPPTRIKIKFFYFIKHSNKSP